MIHSYNLEKLIKIAMIDSYLSIQYIYKEEKRSWLFNKVIRKKGIYDVLMFGRGRIINELPRSHVLIDKCIYKRLSVVLFFENDYTHTLYFDTLKEAQSFKDEIKEKRKTVWFDRDKI